MIYWYIAGAFFLLVTAVCLYAMITGEFEVSAIGIIDRIGLCFAVACVWPVAVLLAISLAVAYVLVDL